MRLPTCLLLGGLSLSAETPENVLDVWAHQYAATQHLPPSFALTARFARVDGKPALAFRFTNISGAPLAIDEGWLPWNYPGSLHIAAFTTDGKRLRNWYGHEPRRTVVRLAPGEWREGNFLISRDLSDPIPTDKDIIIIWLFRMPLPDKPDLELKDWPSCTGAVAIPKSK